jgi:hypothetical protein
VVHGGEKLVQILNIVDPPQIDDTLESLILFFFDIENTGGGKGKVIGCAQVAMLADVGKCLVPYGIQNQFFHCFPCGKISECR